MHADVVEVVVELENGGISKTLNMLLISIALHFDIT